MRCCQLAQSILALSVTAILLVAVQAQTAPPTLSSSLPPGALRGTTIPMTIEGTNLGGAEEIIFSRSGLTAKITGNAELPKEKPKVIPGNSGAVIEDHSTRNKLTAQVTIADDVPPGRYPFRIKTALGLTNSGALTVGRLIELAEKEPNNSPAAAQKITWPATVVGTINEVGDTDHFQFEAQAGQELVFELSAAAIGSRLDSVITLLDAQGRVLAGNDDYNGQMDSILGYRFREAGPYVVRIGDALNNGSARHYYRLTLGDFPLVTQVFPLGIPRQGGGEVTLEGFNLGDQTVVKLTPPANAANAETIPLPFQPPKGTLMMKPLIGLGDYPEVFEQEPNDDLKSAQTIALPIIINGRIHQEKTARASDQDLYRFRAQKGQKLIFGVMAQRLGSPLDSVIEILDAQGKAVPRVTVRSLWETYLNFRDYDAQSGSMRLFSWGGLRPNDYVLVGNELLQVEALPHHPDEDLRFKRYRGRRLTYEDTTPGSHSINTALYKVSLHKPDEKLPPNGMPVFHITYRNDDGAPAYGKDSRLTFTARESGEYYLRIKDIRDQQGMRFAYRLAVAEPHPDFTLTASLANANIPQGGANPLTVNIERKDGFTAPVEVEVLDLPAGVVATRGTIPPEETSVTLALRAAHEPKIPPGGATFRVQGKARISDRELTRVADSMGSLFTVSPPADLSVSVEPPQLQIEPGGTAEVKVTIRRANGFTGRVPLEVRNLPAGVFVPDIGLNGILITEEEDRRVFHIQVDPKVKPFEQLVYVVGRVETTSSIPSEHLSLPIHLRVVASGGERPQAKIAADQR